MIKALHKFRSISLHYLHPLQAKDIDIEEYIKRSARLKVTFRLLNQIHSSGEKVLIFLESRAMQPLLASLIKQKYNLHRMPMIINGLVSGEARQKRVNKFQYEAAGFDVMIISPRAGGVGLNLTAANNVIHLERWWNPAVEDQCTDRAYRMGQTKEVKVFVPISKSESVGERSFDCVLNRLLCKKRSLAEGLFIPTRIEENEFAREIGIQPEGLSLEEVDCLESGRDFEEYVRRQLEKSGLKASLTPPSRDYGADLIVKNEVSGKTAIIQCKHRSSGDKTVSEGAASEVVKAKSSYDLENPRLFIITNAGSITKGCGKTCQEENIEVILRSRFPDLGSIIRAKLED